GVPAAGCHLLEDGDVLALGPQGATRPERVPAGRVFVDGKGIGEVGDVVLRDRRHLSEAGLVLAVLAIAQQSGEIAAGPGLASPARIWGGGAWSRRRPDPRSSTVRAARCSRPWARSTPSRAPIRPRSRKRSARIYAAISSGWTAVQSSSPSSSRCSTRGRRWWGDGGTEAGGGRPGGAGSPSPRPSPHR